MVAALSRIVAPLTARFAAGKEKGGSVWALWMAMIVLMLALCGGFGLIIMQEAKDETKDALESARRLILMLEDNRILGNIITTPEAIEAAPAPSDVSDTQDSGPVEVDVQEGAITAKPLLENMSKVALPSVPTARMMAEPLAALQEQNEFGVAPIKASNGARPWKYYAKPYTKLGDQPMIAVVVTGLGHNRLVTDHALRLNEYVSLSFSPYASDIGQWAASARASGHELYLDLPLEPTNYPATDPGPYGLLLDKGRKENGKTLEWLLSRLPAFTGVVTPQHESYTTNNDGLQWLLQSIGERGLLLAMGRQLGSENNIATYNNSPTARITADVIIDETLSPEIIKAKLVWLEQLAKKNGHAVAIAHSYPLSIVQLREWLPTLASRNIVLVPLSAVANEVNDQ